MLRSTIPASVLASVRRAWRRSLQLRVVTITLLATSALVGTFGLFLSSPVTDGLIRAKENAAVATVLRDSSEAADRLNSLISDPTDTLAPTNVKSVVTALSGNSGVTVEVVAEDQRTRQLTTAPP